MRSCGCCEAEIGTIMTVIINDLDIEVEDVQAPPEANAPPPAPSPAPAPEEILEIMKHQIERSLRVAAY
jgi:hypothetical protein